MQKFLTRDRQIPLFSALFARSLEKWQETVERSSPDPFSEEVAGQKERSDSDGGEGPVFGEQDPDAGPLEEDLPQDHEEITKWIDERHLLDEWGHVGDRGRETREDDGGNEKEKGPQETLLLGGDQRGDHESDPQSRQGEEEDPQIEGKKGSSKRDVEEKDGDQDDDGGFGETDNEPGNDLSHDDVERAQRSHQELVEGPVLPLPCHRQGRDKKGDHQGQETHDPRHDEPPALEVGIVPGPDREGRDRRSQTVLGHKGVVVALDDGLHVSHEDHGRVALASVHQSFHRPLAPPQKITAEGVPDVKDQKDLPVVDEGSDLPFGVDCLQETEVGGSGESRQDLPGVETRVLVPDGVGDVVQIEGRRVAEDDELDERGDDQDHAGLLVPEKRQELLLGEPQDAERERLHRILFRLIRTRSANRKREKARRAIALGTITPGMFPARKTDWRMVTK